MRARPGRLLPSVIVGGLLASGLALGAGTASAEASTQILKSGDTCTITTAPADTDAQKDAATGFWVGKVVDDLCKQTVEVPGTVVGAVAGVADAATSALSGATPAAAEPTTKTVTLGAVSSSKEEKAAQAAKDKAAKDKAAADKKAADDAAAAQLKQQQAQQGGGIVPPPAALGAPAPLAAAGPAGALPALPPLGGIAPAGLATNLFAANSYDPGLLFGSPLGNAASALFSPKADSDVTTVSQAQVLPTAASSGYGTPATIGVIILACLIGFAVRHRVISRMKAREVPAEEYQPRHAAPELADTDAGAASEVAGEPVPDDARTLVVLTQR